ncbi:branched-chain amino acid aminotransferase [Christensenella timonensis]|uniref:branched-chain amino acid aminotransferase n=1 Tax=Christensenella timonensis TaxID=1816678 RepID=UPI00082A5E3E|nr:branched-chain amino acid aminotransferase [Christensenella timonensis]
MEIKFLETDGLKKKPEDESNLGFGTIFSDYMFIMRYTEGQGWHDAEIKKYEDFKISPAATVFHYSQEVFEGLKAYRQVNGDIVLFRAKDNFKRMNNSARRLAMPLFDEAFAHQALRELVKIDQDWIPHQKGTALYIRPNYIGMDPFIGVRAAREYAFYIMMGPVGAYYANGLQPVKILIEKEYTRSAKGGMGFAKTGGNYAASLIAGVEAHGQGCDQVLWLDAEERKYVEEVGSMNIMFVIDGKLVTPELDGCILPGITRDSVMTIARDMGIEVEERRVSVEEVVETAKSGAMSEAFGTGTAAVVSPVGEFMYGDETVTVAGGKMGKLALEFYDILTGIQYGEIKDKFGWTETI